MSADATADFSRPTASASPRDPAAARHEARPDDEPVVVIQPRKGWIAIDFAELWRFRELLFFLTWRDVKVKYKMAILGIVWALLTPILFTLVFATFGNQVGLDDKVPVPYLLFMLAGVVPWQMFFTQAISRGGMALVTEQRLLSKIYMPRLYMPLSAVGGAMFDTILALVVVGGVFVLYRFAPPLDILALPLVMLLSWFCACGIVFLLSALTVMYRDLRFVIPFATQLGLWLSAVPFPLETFGEKTQLLLALNPITGIIAAWRSCLLGVEWKWLHLSISVAASAVMFVWGLYYFRRVERRVADIS